MDILYAPPANGEAEMAKQLAPTIKQLKEVADFGRMISQGINHIIFVSAGAGLAIGRSLKQYTDHEVGGDELRYTVYPSATFVNHCSTKPWIANDANTMVILSSKSGTTSETVAAAKSLQGKACKTVVFTKSDDVELASFGHHMAFFTGDTTQAFHATYMLMTAFLGGILAARDENWTMLSALLSSLKALPTALFHAALKGVQPGEEFATKFRPQDPIYFVASGSAGLVPHAFGLCILQERFAFDVHVVDGADFFHSVVETVRPSSRNHYILIIPADDSRAEMLDVKTFFEVQSKTREICFHVIDTREFDLLGIDPQLVGIFGPVLAEAFLKPWAPPLAKVAGRSMNDPLVHMGKFDYYGCHRA